MTRATFCRGQMVVEGVAVMIGGAVDAEAAGPATFEGFVAERGQALQRTAYLLTGDWRLAEDLVQTALARVYPRWHAIERADPDPYVRQVMVRTWSSWWRRKWRGERPTADLPEQMAPDVFEDADRRNAVHAALAKLPTRQRAVVVLRFHEDMTEVQVAKALGVTVGTVKSQTAKALERLRGDAGLTSYDRR